MLLKKLSKGKHFYKGTTLILKIDLNLINKKELEIIKNALLTEIEIKAIVLEDIEKEVEKVQEKETRVFSGVYEGKTKFIRKTIRGGQSISYQGNIVIIGDINSGAEIYADGRRLKPRPATPESTAGSGAHLK